MTTRISAEFRVFCTVGLPRERRAEENLITVAFLVARPRVTVQQASKCSSRKPAGASPAAAKLEAELEARASASGAARVCRLRLCCPRVSTGLVRAVAFLGHLDVVLCFK